MVPSLQLCVLLLIRAARHAWKLADAALTNEAERDCHKGLPKSEAFLLWAQDLPLGMASIDERTNGALLERDVATRDH